MEIRFFGKLTDVFGDRLSIDQGPCSVAQLRARLIASHPASAEFLKDGRARVFVGDALVPESGLLTSGQDVEFLAPVSGG